MTFLQKSAKRQLQERFGQQPRTARLRRGDWMGLSCGASVYDTADPRHIGRLEAIKHGAWATVRWEETDWLSDVPVNQLRRVT